MKLKPRARARAARTVDLENALSRVVAGGAGRVRVLGRRRNPYRSSHAIEQLCIGTDAGSRRQIIFKDLSPEALTATGRRVRPRFLFCPEREIELYRSTLAEFDFGTAAFQGAVVEAARQRYWLFLECFNGHPIAEEANLAVWPEAARWLARVHTHFGGEQWRGTDFTALGVHYGADHFHRWLRRARTLQVAKSARRILTAVAPVYRRAIDLLAALPTTLIHGDCFAANILVAGQSDGWRICPVDWEIAGFGPGCIDLAALSAGRWTDLDRACFRQAYRSGLSDQAGARASMCELEKQVDCAYLYLAIRFLGWARAWRPPSAQAQNWLAEAERIGERLTL